MGPIKTTVLLKGGYIGCHVSLEECRVWAIDSYEASPVEQAYGRPLTW